MLSRCTNKQKLGIAKLIQTKLLKELAGNLNNFTSVTPEQWQVTINKLKNYKKMIKLDGDTFSKFIDKLLPLLGAYLGAMFTFKQNRANNAEAGIPEVQLPNGQDSSTMEQFLEESKKQMPVFKNSVFKVPDWCDQEKYKFSYILKEEDDSSSSDSSNTDCIPSLCPPTEETNFDHIEKNSVLKQSKGVLVEYDNGYPHVIKVQVGSVISFNDNIGSIKDLPVKSHIRGIVTKKTDNYFIADYLDDVPEIDADALIAKYSNKRMEEICDLFSDNANITMFIKDYLLETRIPSLANHLREHLLGAGNEVSSAKYIKKYRKKAEKINKKYEKKTKKACSKETVEAYGRKSKLHKLKEKLDENKRNAFDQLIDLYENYKSLGYCSKGRIGDYMLYDEYLDFLMDEEKFRYDDKNPYVVKMFKLMCKFIGVRSKIEKNMDNLPSLVEKFNVLCKKTIRKYWKPRNNDYYNEMKNIFKYEYYTNDTEQLVKALATDADAVSMFSKVYDYLKTVCHYITPASETIEYSDEIDVKALLKSGKEDTTDRKMDSDLRKIAYNFCLLRNVETSANDESIFNTLANRSIVTAFYYLHLVSGILIDTYYEGYIGIDPVVLANRAILRPYLKTLKKITQNEAYEMDKLGKEVLTWYRTKGEAVNDPHLFDEFMEIPWAQPMQIVHEDEYYDYIPLMYQKEDAATQLKKAEAFDFDAAPTDDYYNTLQYMKSASGPNSFLYWLRYLAIATVVNCMLPIYWGTGIIIMGSPVILPIIMLPIYALGGRVTVVFGIGLCGICPMPLILFVNLGNERGSLLIPLNILADTLKASLKQVMNQQQKVVAAAYTPVLASLDAKITAYNKELEDLDNQIHNLDSYVKNNKKIVRNIKKRKKEDPTTQVEHTI